MKKHIKDYICPKCFNQIQNCICEYSPYTLLMIDEPMQYAIKNLNQKNITTESCCASHYKKKNQETIMYISFTECPKEIPIDWKKNGNRIHYKFCPKDKKEFIETQKKEIEKLNQWTDNISKR